MRQLLELSVRTALGSLVKQVLEFSKQVGNALLCVALPGLSSWRGHSLVKYILMSIFASKTWQENQYGN